MVGCRAHRFHSPTGGRAQITSSSLRACFCCAALHFGLVAVVAVAAAAAFSLVVTALLHLFSILLWRFIRHLLLALFSEVLRRSLSLSLYVSLSLCLCDPVFPTLTASVSRYVWNFERCKAISSM